MNPVCVVDPEHYTLFDFSRVKYTLNHSVFKDEPEPSDPSRQKESWMLRRLVYVPDGQDLCLRLPKMVAKKGLRRNSTWGTYAMMLVFPELWKEKPEFCDLYNFMGALAEWDYKQGFLNTSGRHSDDEIPSELVPASPNVLFPSTYLMTGTSFMGKVLPPALWVKMDNETTTFFKVVNDDAAMCPYDMVPCTDVYVTANILLSWIWIARNRSGCATYTSRLTMHHVLLHDELVVKDKEKKDVSSPVCSIPISHNLPQKRKVEVINPPDCFPHVLSDPNERAVNVKKANPNERHRGMSPIPPPDSPARYNQDIRTNNSKNTREKSAGEPQTKKPRLTMTLGRVKGIATTPDSTNGSRGKTVPGAPKKKRQSKSKVMDSDEEMESVVKTLVNMENIYEPPIPDIVLKNSE